MFQKYPDIVSVEDIAEMLNIGKSSAYSLLQSNQIRHVRVGKKYIIPKRAVIGFLGGTRCNEDVITGGRLQSVTKGDAI
jgi:excisionase family DNA binding protein